MLFWVIATTVMATLGLLVFGPAPASPRSPNKSLSVSPTVAATAGNRSASVGAAESVPPSPAVSAAPSMPPSAAGRFGLGLLIADRGNGRLLIVDDAKHVLWRFPVAGSLPKGQRFSADDAFIAPDGRTIVANDEAHQVIDRIDIASRRVVWQYGNYDRIGSRAGFLHTPDDAYPLANGDIVVADIRNCRILEISAAKRIVRHWGHAGDCSNRPPAASITRTATRPSKMLACSSPRSAAHVSSV